MVAETSSSERRSSPATDSSPEVLVGSSMARSRPAEKDCPSPLTTTTRTSSGSPAPRSASARHIVGVWALRTSGRLNVIVATAPSTSYLSPACTSFSASMLRTLGGG